MQSNVNGSVTNVKGGGLVFEKDEDRLTPPLRSSSGVCGILGG